MITSFWFAIPHLQFSCSGIVAEYLSQFSWRINKSFATSFKLAAWHLCSTSGWKWLIFLTSFTKNKLKRKFGHFFLVCSPAPALNLNKIMSPSSTTYSLPFCLYFPFACKRLINLITNELKCIKCSFNVVHQMEQAFWKYCSSNTCPLPAPTNI